MPNLQVSQKLIFSGTDLSRPRMSVEAEKINACVSGFSLYGSEGKVTSVRGVIITSYEHSYNVRITVPEHYPYVIPQAFVEEPLDSCPHRYTDGSLCLMKNGQWSSTLSLAFIIVKTAVWLNKYDAWRRAGSVQWPGTQQRH